MLICAVPFMIKAGDVLDYEGTSMTGQDADSLIGAEIIAENFNPPALEMESTVLLVVNYDDLEGKVQAWTLMSQLDNGLSSYVDDNGDQKIDRIVQYGLFETDAGDGILMSALIYNEEMLKDYHSIVYDTDKLRDFISNVIDEHGIQGLETYVTGSPAISYDTEKGSSEDIAKIDPFTILLILVLVGLFFRSFVTSAMPPMTIGVAFGLVMCIMYFLGSVMEIFYITEMFLLVSMLGAGCDYCIFILARYREERVKGNDHEDALRSSIMWAGESITISGLAVMIGFGAMSICSFSMISTMGIMLAIGIVLALLAALTLITSILAIFGERLFWPSKVNRFGPNMKGWYGKVSRAGHGYFVRSVRFSMKHAKLIIVASVLLTIPSVYIVMTSESSYDMVGSMSSGEAVQGLNEIEDYSNGGMIMPNYVVLELSDHIAELKEMQMGDHRIGFMLWTNPSYISSLSTLSSDLGEDDNVGEIWGIYVWSSLVSKAVGEIGPKIASESDEDYALRVFEEAVTYLPETLSKEAGAVLGGMVILYHAISTDPLTYDSFTFGMIMDYTMNYVMASSVGGTDQKDDEWIYLDYVKFTIITEEESMSDRSMDTINYIDDTRKMYALDNPDIIAGSWLTGNAVVMYEISEKVNSEFVKVEILAIFLIFLLLFVVMKSFVTPLRSIGTILMSVAWTIALTHLLFTSLLGVGVIWMIPIILIVICLGLGMDYDILLTTRIRENRMHRGMTNDEAITAAVTHSGSVITICGLIMGGAFGTLMLSSTTMLQEFGFALCFAILVDALIVRTYIVPAAMHLLGDWNWKGPKFIQRKDMIKRP